MKLQTVLCVIMIVELSLVHLIDGKRSFGLTRSRNKSKTPSVRRNQHGHSDFDDHPKPVSHPKPSAPEASKPVGWNTNQQTSGHNNQPQGPPPAYPGMGHNSAAPHGAPPAYSPSHANPPSYSSSMGQNQPRPGMFNQPNQGYNSPYGGNHIGGQMPMMNSGPPMGGMMMGSPYGSNYGYNRGSGMGSGIMTNLFAGLAGYQLAKAFSGGHRDREVHIYDNRQPVQPLDSNPTADNAGQTLSINQEQNSEIPTANIPQIEQATQAAPANNDYNYYGIPQYGVPLYGFNVPAQPTNYYSTSTVKETQENDEENSSESESAEFTSNAPTP